MKHEYYQSHDYIPHKVNKIRVLSFTSYFFNEAKYSSCKW